MTARGPRVAAVLLAAGESRRMGGIDKRLLTLDGVPLVRRWLDVFRGAGITDVVVVLGHEPQRVRPLLEGSGATVVVNPGYRRGQQSSVLAGLAALPGGIDAVLVALVDLVLVDAQDLRELIDAFVARPAGTAIVVPFHRGSRGNPVIVSAEVASAVASGHELAAPGGDPRAASPDPSSAGPEPGGLRAYLQSHPGEVHRHEAGNDHFVVDLDTREDIARLERRLGRAFGNDGAGRS
ncbi:MAG TPA: nucleotidyltransferase family protein [Quisquiliibacterium sp.]|nr:nucleotidyltransferase family protein [Quisquiliibacterium sp.]